MRRGAAAHPRRGRALHRARGRQRAMQAPVRRHLQRPGDQRPVRSHVQRPRHPPHPREGQALAIPRGHAETRRNRLRRRLLRRQAPHRRGQGPARGARRVPLPPVARGIHADAQGCRLRRYPVGDHERQMAAVRQPTHRRVSRFIRSAAEGARRGAHEGAGPVLLHRAAAVHAGEPRGCAHQGAQGGLMAGTESATTVSRVEVFFGFLCGGPVTTGASRGGRTLE